MSLFEDLTPPARQTGGILFRVEHLAGQVPAFLIRSIVKPLNLPRSAKLRELREDNLEPGQPIAFRITVNAVQRLDRGKGIRPVVFDHEEPQRPGGIAMTPWLSQKLQGSVQGLTISRHDRSVLGVDRHGKAFNAGEPTIQVDLVDGVGEVEDPVRLSAQMASGIGRAKSYGCGLLTVKPLA